MSWTICDKLRFIFIHIPKTGGTSINGSARYWNRTAFKKNIGDRLLSRPGHMTSEVLVRKYGWEKYNSYFKFCFVREPLERAVSLFYALVRKTPYGELSRNNFENWVVGLRGIRDFVPWAYPQHRWIDVKGKYMVDYIGDFAHIQTCFDEVCDKIGIERVNLNKVNSSYIKNYDIHTSKTEDIIREVYAKDFELYERIKR